MSRKNSTEILVWVVFIIAFMIEVWFFVAFVSVFKNSIK